MNLTRRSLLTTLTATSTLTLAGCSSSSSKKTPTTTPSGSASGTTAAAAAINPVKGFGMTPAWSQPARSGTPLTSVGAAWSQGHAWFCTQVTESQFVITAYDPISKQAITSPTQNGDLTNANLYPVVCPSEGLILYVSDGTSGCITLSGSTITIKKVSDPTGTDNKPQWMGDALFITPSDLTKDGDPTNTETPQPAQALDVAKGAWVKITPQNSGMIVAGLTRIDGGTQNIEVTPNKWTNQTQVKIGQNTGTMLGAIFFALGGKILASSTDGRTLTPADELIRTNKTGVWTAPASITQPFPCPTALSADRDTAITPTGNRYNSASNTVTTGVCTDNTVPQWALINTSVTSSALYANSNPDSGSVQDASAGAFVGTTTIPASPDPKTQAPVLVMPDGSGLFSTPTGWVALPATH